MTLIEYLRYFGWRKREVARRLHTPLSVVEGWGETPPVRVVTWLENKRLSHEANRAFKRDIEPKVVQSINKILAK